MIYNPYLRLHRALGPSSMLLQSQMTQCAIPRFDDPVKFEFPKCSQPTMDVVIAEFKDLFQTITIIFPPQDHLYGYHQDVSQSTTEMKLNNRYEAGWSRESLRKAVALGWPRLCLLR